MDMNQLFIALPRDLQWEILSEFVGTHVVRNGKLMRKISGNINFDQHKYLKRDRPCYNWIYNMRDDEANKRRFVRFPANGSSMMFCRDFRTDETIYLYRKSIQLHSLWDSIWEVQFEPVKSCDSVILEPFIKHQYPSYPYTNKKMRRK